MKHGKIRDPAWKMLYNFTASWKTWDNQLTKTSIMGAKLKT